MWHTIILGLLGGLIAANGIPHFIRGITRQRYPCVLGNSPLPNLIAGWAGLIVGSLLIWWARIDLHPTSAFISISMGVLLIGLFHAGPGAFGRNEAQQ